MGTRGDNGSPPIMTTKRMPGRLNVYTDAFGYRHSDTVLWARGERRRETLGFDSPLIVLLPAHSSSNSPESLGVAIGDAPAGFEFCFGTTGSEITEEFFLFARAKGIAVIREPRRPCDDRG
jgi:hypothetical protein